MDLRWTSHVPGRQPTPTTCAAAAGRHRCSRTCEVHARYEAGTSPGAMSAVRQLEPGHRPPAAPPPSSPRSEARNELKPATAFRIPPDTGQVRHPGSAPIGDLDPDNPVPRADRVRDVSLGSPDRLCRILLPNSSLTSGTAASPHGCPGPSTLADERSGQPRPLYPPGKCHGLPDHYPVISAPPSQLPTPRETRGPPGGHTGMHARLGGARQSGTRRRHGPSMAVRGKPAVTPTVLTARRRPLCVRGQRDTAARARQGDTPRDREETAR